MKKITKKIVLLLITTVLLLTVSCASTSKEETNNVSDLQISKNLNYGTMDNGMSYYVMSNSEPKNRIILRLVVKAGSCMEDDDQNGVAHLIEHMAFNGTENFNKNETIEYMESIGMSFGNEVNAYTSFEETVYKLEIPADNPEVLAKAMLIIKDWASAIKFDPIELDKERGVIKEEWRLRQGLQSRSQKALSPFFLGDSKYVEHDVIGSMDVIENVSRDRVIDFYKKWYRPELMSVIAVGDIDTETLLKAVETSMSTIPASKEKVVLPDLNVSIQEGKKVLIYKDKEQKGVYLTINSRVRDYKPTTTEEIFKEKIFDEITRNIFNQRLGECSQNVDCPWLSGYVTYQNFTNTTLYDLLIVNPKEGMVGPSLASLLQEYERFTKFGVTEGELSRIKSAYLNMLEQNELNISKTTSYSHIDNLINYIINGYTFISEEDRIALYRKYVNMADVGIINEYAKKIVPDRGELLYLFCSENAKDIPTEEEILDFWKNFKVENELTAYKDDLLSDSLMEKPAISGKIEKTTKLKEFDADEYYFENGLRVIIKKTDFIKDQFSMNMVSKGGLSLVSDEDFPSGNSAVFYTLMSGINGFDYNQFVKIITSQNVNLYINAGENNETFTSTCNNKNFETVLQIINLLLTKPQFSDEGWNQVMANSINQAESHGLTPNDVLIDKIKELIFKSDIRKSAVTKEYVEMLDKAAAERIFKERFSNIADFDLVITGDVDDKKAVELISSYLGSLPGDKNAREQSKYKYYDQPKGIETATVKKGTESLGVVYLAFKGILPPAKNNEEKVYDKEMISKLAELMQIQLREIIREDKSGTYGVSVQAGIDKSPEREYIIELSLGCKPENQNEFTSTIINYVKNLQEKEVEIKYTKDLAEAYKRNLEIALRTNEWWVEHLHEVYVDENEPLNSLDLYQSQVPTWITPVEMKKVAQKYLDINNYYSVYLVPENY